MGERAGRGQAALRARRLQVRDLTGMTYNPLTRRYALGRDIDVNYLMCARFDD